ncbi:Zn(II)2Cys6 transcription factor domain-containing protein [Aspergillus mulundensis]|uniref:C6 transcription factor n=1 Tax=Aspergillus mulundensis TaxID=1810919 RepID=A0A3D8SD75_9EURO|nr:C6 transcription factor [Aspergillus mulundensis]RDW84121.1 C6 transcription factor [Aspergillus mulundensis]
MGVSNCDERKPACDKCKVYGVDCSFALSANSTEQSVSCSDQDTTPAVGTPQAPPSAGSELAISDLELLHHYTTSTAYTFSHHPALQTFWRVEAPKIAFTAPYTLRAILAMSALHLSVLRPEKKDLYIAQASEHNDAALKLATPEITNISPENATPLFLFSALLSFISCAKPLKLGNFLLWEDHDIADWLSLIRGTGTIVESANDSLRTGPLGIIFSVHRQSHNQPDPVVRHEFLEDLRVFILEEVTDEHEREVYSVAIDHLSHCFAICLDKAWRLETSDVFMWLLRVPADFLRLLKGHQPHALMVLGYFCVLMHQLEWMWWMKNWERHILSQIYHLLPAPLHRAWLQWPMEQVGFSPS